MPTTSLWAGSSKSLRGRHVARPFWRWGNREKIRSVRLTQIAYMRGSSLCLWHSRLIVVFSVTRRISLFQSHSFSRLDPFWLIDKTRILGLSTPLGYHIIIYSRTMASKSQAYRTSSPKSTSRRPRLMRASATCPQLATSNASRKDLASLQSCGATTILTRVASYSMAQHEHAMRASHSTCSSPDQRSPESASMESRKEPFEVAIHQCE